MRPSRQSKRDGYLTAGGAVVRKVFDTSRVPKIEVFLLIACEAKVRPMSLLLVVPIPLSGVVAGCSFSPL